MNARHFVIPLVGLLLAAADDPRQAAVKDELGKLKGEWKLVSANKSGKERTADDLDSQAITFDGDQYIVKVDGEFAMRATWVIDPTARPKTFEWTVTEAAPVSGVEKGAKVHGIYEVDGDTLRVCRVKIDRDLPRGFDPGPGVGIFTAKRVKP